VKNDGFFVCVVVLLATREICCGAKNLRLTGARNKRAHPKSVPGTVVGFIFISSVVMTNLTMTR
jgi:hypothetical protein